MSEGVFQVVQLGRQSAVGTGVSATTVFPVDAGFMGLELDRATEIPNEDFGSTSRDYAGRASHGVRWATGDIEVVGRFEDIMHLFEMHVAAVSGGTATGGTYTYTFDETSALLSSGLKPYTLEYGVNGTTQDEWRGIGVIADELELGFDALTAPGNSMWKAKASLVALNRTQTALTDSLTAPGTLTTMEGHLTTIADGSTSTAFGSLSALTASLKQYSFKSKIGAVGRVYGGSSDTATAIGRSDKGEIDFDALILISSTTDTNIRAIYDVSGSVPTERRWRVVTTVGTQSMTIDGRVLFTKVARDESDGEVLYAVSGKYLYDSTLAGRMKITLVSNVTTIP